MNSSPEDFNQLKKLLAVKRHEAPPPRYFEDFSERVRVRLETEPAPKVSWLQRLMATLDVHPMTAAAYGAAVCALLLVGVRFAYQTGSTASVQPDPLVVQTPAATPDPLVPSHGTQATTVADTNTSAPPGLFGPIPGTQTERVNFQTK